MPVSTHTDGRADGADGQTAAEGGVIRLLWLHMDSPIRWLTQLLCCLFCRAALVRLPSLQASR